MGLQNVTSRGEMPPRVDGRNCRDAKSKYAEEQDRGHPVAGKSRVLGASLSCGGVGCLLRGDVLIHSFRAALFHSVHVNQSGHSSEKSGAQRKCSLVCRRRLAQNSPEFQSQQGVLRSPREAGGHLVNGSREGTASAVPKSTRNSGVLTPEIGKRVAGSIYEITSRRLGSHHASSN